MKPDKIYEGRSTIRMYNCDCMELMDTDREWDLAIVDPPYFKGVADKNFYGSDRSNTGVDRLCSQSNNWDSNIPTQKYFNKLLRYTKNHIVWGCNYYPYDDMPNGRLVWDKKNDSSTFSNCEIASCSKITSVKIYRQVWNGMIREGENKPRIHPTQKPINLYRWLLTNYAEEGDTILDTHGGSMSLAIACWEEGFDLDICELDEDYFNDAVERFENHIAQTQLF